MLLGEFRHSIDAKGRVFLPAKWREELPDEVVLTKGLDRCLYLMSKDRFEQMAGRLSQLPLNRRDNRNYSRILFGGAYEEQVDRQGRITVPVALREYAGLEKEIVLAGVSERAEVWDRVAWNQHQERILEEYEDIAEKLEL